jgi:hypothetical protein
MATAPGAARPEPRDVQLTLLRRWFAGWHRPIGELLAATDPEDLVQETVTELRPVLDSLVFPAGDGGYVLVGDAAHALADHLGQGAGLALEDAATLQALVRDAVPGRALIGALQAYHRARRPRVVRLARQARRLGTALQASGRFGSRARGAALGAVAPRLLGSAAAVANEWQPPPTCSLSAPEGAVLDTGGLPAGRQYLHLHPAATPAAVPWRLQRPRRDARLVPPVRERAPTPVAVHHDRHNFREVVVSRCPGGNNFREVVTIMVTGWRREP